MERKELFVTDLKNAFGPVEHISDRGDKTMWCSVPYETIEYKGNLLASPAGQYPGDICYDPKLNGWYKIYVAFPGYPISVLNIKLTKDITYVYIHNHDGDPFSIEEVLWRCADMTNQSISISKTNTTPNNMALAWLRFVPMSDEEVQAFKADNARTDTKRVYATEDMGNGIWDNEKCSVDDWRAVVSHMRDSDVEWFSPEFYNEDFGYSCNFMKYDRYEAIVDEAHKLGMKVAVSNRMGLWGAGYPYSYYGCGVRFVDEHPEYHCIDRNGEMVNALSYAYPEVRRLKIQDFVAAAKCGADAVMPLGHRGVPYVLFEKPVADAFYEKYGEYPYELPLDEPRLRDIHCEFMTQYFRELREALDNEFGKDKIQIHLRCYNSIEDSAYIGFDVYKLAEEGLLDAVATHARKFFEFIPDEIRKDDDKSRIDLDKFNEYVHQEGVSVWLTWEDDCYSKTTNSYGDEVNPHDFAENVRQWKEFSNKFGIRVYHEMFHMCRTNEDIKKNIPILYENGGDGITLFNTCLLSHEPARWNLLSKIGHKEEFNDLELIPGGYRKVRVLKFSNVDFNRYKPIWGG